MIFLGIDESNKGGLEYQSKNKYLGAPYFAVDVTPKERVKEECEKLIKSLEEKGMAFAQGRVMDIDARHGMIIANLGNKGLFY
jgi:NAD+ diphosphatase